jgi:hypothetical protein
MKLESRYEVTEIQVPTIGKTCRALIEMDSDQTPIALWISLGDLKRCIETTTQLSSFKKTIARRFYGDRGVGYLAETRTLPLDTKAGMQPACYARAEGAVVVLDSTRVNRSLAGALLVAIVQEMQKLALISEGVEATLLRGYSPF